MCDVVSVCRALLRKPSLLLCDEVTSSVDALAEREIIQALRGASSTSSSSSASIGQGAQELDQQSGQIPVHRHGVAEEPDSVATPSSQPPRTTITVAHRLSSIAHCDRIFVLQRGRLVEQGTHRELLSIPGGVYRTMWEVQNSVEGEAGGAGGQDGYDIWGEERRGNVSHNTRMHSFF